MVNFCKSSKCLVGKVAVITGANAGLGYQAALEFAKRGCRVILACRSQEKANKVRDEIIRLTGNRNVVVKLVNLESMESVRQLASSIRTENRLDILVNNAGTFELPDRITDDGLQVEVAVNYFSHFLLTHLLLDLLKASAPSRVINVSSSAAMLYSDFDAENINKHEGHIMLYCKTKLCNIYFTQEFANRYQNSGIMTYSVHPGVVHTNFQRFSTVLNFMVSKFCLTAEEGVQTILHVSLADGIENYNGQHFEDCKPVKPYGSARDGYMRSQLWEITEKMLRLKPR